MNILPLTYQQFRRHLLQRAMCPAVYVLLGLAALLQGCGAPAINGPAVGAELPLIRAVQVDLDYVFDSDPEQQKANLELLVRRINNLNIHTVFLQAFADPDGNGVAESLYFPNRFLPLQEDLFADAALALRQNGVAVYGWLPLLAFHLPGDHDDLYVLQNNHPDPPTRAKNSYQRLSPFNPKAREIIQGIYQDFSQITAIDGILFHDDGLLSDFEDASTAALQLYSQFGFPADIQAIRINQSTMRQWSRFKTRYLIDFSLYLVEIIRNKQPGIRTVRNLYAQPVLQPHSEMWFAQSLPLFLQAYDYTALMAMPYLEDVAEPEPWFEQLAWSALDMTTNSNRIIFELQSQNWRTNEPIAGDILQEQIILLSQLGVTSFAYYPDDFYNNKPPADIIKSCLANSASCVNGDSP